MAKLLATYDVLPPIGADGKEYIPKIEMTPGLVRSVLPQSSFSREADLGYRFSATRRRLTLGLSLAQRKL